MFKNKLCLEVKGNDNRLYSFECEPNAPLGEMYDALYTMRTVLVEHINQLEKQEKKEPEEKEVAHEVAS